MTVEVDKASARVLDLSIGLYQRQLHKDMFNAVKKAAYEVSRSLIARTRRAKAGPKVAIATKADMDALVDMIKYTGRNGESVESWRAYLKSLGRERRAWITRSDRRKDKGYRHKKFWLRDQWSKEAVKQANAYEYRGLAKQSWRWCASKTKSGASSGKWSDKLEENCSVSPNSRDMSVRIVNRLPYIVDALTSPGAVGEACRAAAKQLRHWAKEAMEEAKVRQGWTANA